MKWNRHDGYFQAGDYIICRSHGEGTVSFTLTCRKEILAVERAIPEKDLEAREAAGKRLMAAADEHAEKTSGDPAWKGKQPATLPKYPR